MIRYSNLGGSFVIWYAMLGGSSMNRYSTVVHVLVEGSLNTHSILGGVPWISSLS